MVKPVHAIMIGATANEPEVEIVAFFRGETQAEALDAAKWLAEEMNYRRNWSRVEVFLPSEIPNEPIKPIN